DGFDDVESIILGRCSMCHAAEPFYEGIHIAPKGVLLETSAQIAGQARKIYLQSGITHAMPPANVSFIEPEERAQIVAWYRRVTENGG
ncbi:MAG: cysteine desulfurase, partial [Paracoccaceae bacterium]|nr:cysteine desulfurase [Paracoccaceae bacterium]